MTWTPRLCISGAGFSSNASTLVLSAAATEQRRRRPGLQKLKTASTQVTGIFHPPPSLPPSSYSSSTFHPRAGLQGTVLGRSRCHSALAWPAFLLQRIPIPCYCCASASQDFLKIILSGHSKTSYGHLQLGHVKLQTNTEIYCPGAQTSLLDDTP